MENYNKWIADLKIGDKVIFEYNNCFKHSYEICTIKNITPKRRYIVLDNSFKFDLKGMIVSRNYSSSSYKIYEYNEKNLKILNDYKKCERGLKAIGLIYDNVNKIKDRISPEDYQKIYDIISKYVK